MNELLTAQTNAANAAADGAPADATPMGEGALPVPNGMAQNTVAPPSGAGENTVAPPSGMAQNTVAPPSGMGENTVAPPSGAERGALPVQTPEENAVFARRRREAELAARLKQARTDAVLEALGGINPLSGVPMKTAADVEQFFAEKARRAGAPAPAPAESRAASAATSEQQSPAGSPAENGENRAASAATSEQQSPAGSPAENGENRAASAATANATPPQTDNATPHAREAEAIALEARYPGVHASELFADEDFVAFAKGKSEPLTDVYAAYRAMLRRFAARENERLTRVKNAAAQALANAKASPGALATGAGAPTLYYTREQVSAMSRAEIRQHYDAILRSTPQW